jgi:hypothetical protein
MNRWCFQSKLDAAAAPGLGLVLIQRSPGSCVWKPACSTQGLWQPSQHALKDLPSNSETLSTFQEQHMICMNCGLQRRWHRSVLIESKLAHNILCVQSDANYNIYTCWYKSSLSGIGARVTTYVGCRDHEFDGSVWISAVERWMTYIEWR